MASTFAEEHFFFSRPSATETLLLCCSTGLATLVVAILSYMWWRSAQLSRARRAGVLSGSEECCLPTPVPVLPKWFGFTGGHTLLIDPAKIVEQLEGWAEEFGGDYELQIFGKRAIVVTALADIRRILTLRPSKFQRGLGVKLRSWAATEAGVLPSLFFAEGKEWGRSRRLISPNLNGHNVPAMLPFISKIGERLCAKLGAQADAGEVVDAKDEFERFTHDVIALTAFGIDVDSIGATQDKPCPSFDAMASATTSIMTLTMKPMSILGWKFLSSALPWVRRAKEHSLQLANVMQGAIDAVRCESAQRGISAASSAEGNEATTATTATPSERGRTLAGGTLLRKIVGTRHGEGSSDRMVFSDREVLHQAKSLFIAGTETTALTLSWAMYYLTKHPKVLARCRAEALQAAPSSSGMVSTSDQMSQLVFCSAVFREALRLRTAAPFLYFHCTEDFTLKSGREFEKGTAFCLLLRAASIAEQSFTRGSDFVPERWIEAERDEALLDKDAGNDKRSVHHVEEAFLSFGGGPRVCPGQDVANAEASIIIAAVCARFDVSLAPGQADPPEEVSSFTCGPKAVDLVFTRRDG